MSGTTTLNVRMDADTKRDFSLFCDELGMSASSLVNVFAKTVVRNQSVPFPLTSRPIGNAEPLPRRLSPQSEQELLDMLSASNSVLASECAPMGEAILSVRERMGW